MDSLVQQVIDEINAELARMAPIHEGLSDYARLNILDETRKEVGAAIAVYDQRTAVLKSARVALEALLGDGYPGLELPLVSKVVYDDLHINRDTVEAALGEFELNEPTQLEIEWGQPVEQPKE